MVERQLRQARYPRRARPRGHGSGPARAVRARARIEAARTPTARCRSASARRSRSRTWWLRRASCSGSPETRMCSTSAPGSGYAAAVLAELAASVTTIERVPELAAARTRRRWPPPAIRPSRSSSATARWACPERAPFHAIAVAAAAPRSAGEPLRAARARRPPRRPDRLARRPAARPDRAEPGRPGRGALAAVPLRAAPRRRGVRAPIETGRLPLSAIRLRSPSAWSRRRASRRAARAGA